VIYLAASAFIVWGADSYRRLVRQHRDLTVRLLDEQKFSKVVVEELAHRLKNKIATIQSIVSYQLRRQPKLMLRTSGYVVLGVGSGGAALDLLDGETNIDLAILDFAMPGMNGVEVARQMNSRFPNLPVLFITGYVDQSVLAEIDEARIVKKPFVGEELATKVNAAIFKAIPRSGGKVLPLRG
jgi:CheY-like chemotaxis protein